jgi:hypothetical protein
MIGPVIILVMWLLMYGSTLITNLQPYGVLTFLREYVQVVRALHYLTGATSTEIEAELLFSAVLRKTDNFLCFSFANFTIRGYALFFTVMSARWTRETTLFSPTSYTLILDYFLRIFQPAINH